MSGLGEKFRKHLIKQARKCPPTQKPGYCFFFGGLLTSVAGLVPIGVHAFRQMPIVASLLEKNIPHYAWMLYTIEAAILAYFALVVWRFLCRGVQLCFPDDLEAFEIRGEELDHA